MMGKLNFMYKISKVFPAHPGLAFASNHHANSCHFEINRYPCKKHFITSYTRIPVTVASETAVTRLFSILQVYVSLMLTGCSLLTTLNIPAVSSVKFVIPFRTLLSYFNHVTCGLGNHLLAVGTRLPSKTLNVGAEKAENKKW